MTSIIKFNSGGSMVAAACKMQVFLFNSYTVEKLVELDMRGNTIDMIWTNLDRKLICATQIGNIAVFKTDD